MRGCRTGLLVSFVLAATAAAGAAGAPTLDSLFVSGTLGIDTFRVPNIARPQPTLELAIGSRRARANTHTRRRAAGAVCLG